MNKNILIIVIILCLLIFYREQSRFSSLGGYYDYLDPNIKNVLGDENDIVINSSNQQIVSGSVYGNMFFPFNNNLSEVKFSTIFTPTVPKPLGNISYGYNSLANQTTLYSEIQLVNYYLNFDPYASLYMRNDTLFLPIDSNSNIIKYDDDAYKGNGYLFSLKSALALPSDSSLDSTVTTPGLPIGYTQPTVLQTKRMSIIVGVLNAMNDLLNNFQQDVVDDKINGNSKAFTEPEKIFIRRNIIRAPPEWKGVMNEFYNNYIVDKPYNFANNYNLDPMFMNTLYPYTNINAGETTWPTDGLKLTENAKHVIWAYLNARTQWIYNKILNFRSI